MDLGLTRTSGSASRPSPGTRYEIQREVIGDRVSRLPMEPILDASKRFNEVVRIAARCSGKNP
jgi:hypothetical protein